MRIVAPVLLAGVLLCAPSASGFSQYAFPSVRRAPPLSATTALPAAAAAAAVRAGTPAVMSSSVPPPDYKLAAAFLGLGVLTLYAPWLVGGFTTLLGLLFIVQTTRVRFVFDDEAFEVKAKELDNLFADDSQLVSSGDNFAVGGDNRWRYDSFVNWAFLPSEDLPILVYFKETQTPKDNWQVGPGKWANSEAAIAKGAVPGQVHFFPCIASPKVLKEQFEARGCKKIA
jgi:NIMA (never in mitosis gene a)-related kinase